MLLPASMGASAVILFVMPHAPIARPWAFAGGHLISAFTGITCAHWIGDANLAASVSVALSIFLMQLARCLHPPGGASAILPVLGGETVRALGYQFLLTPFALNLAAMILLNFVYRRWFFTPKPVMPQAEIKSAERLGIDREDLRAALASVKEFVDVEEEALREIFNLAGAKAFHRHFGDTTAAQVMTENPVTVEFGTGLEEAWALMITHKIKALPVVDRGRFVIGIITEADFMRHVQSKSLGAVNSRLKSLLKPSPGVTSRKPEVVGQIMTAHPLTALETDTLPELARLLTERGIHQAPIVDSRGKLLGILTQTDLIAALYRTLIRI